jgi:hypothetical protein
MRVGLGATAICMWIGGAPLGCYRGSDGGAGGATDSATGGTDSSPGSATESDSAETGESEPPEDSNLVPESMARRMTPQELDNTLEDLIDDNSQPARTVLNEPDYNPFDNDYTIQNPSTALIESLEVMAQDVASRLATDQARLATLVPCEPSGPDDEACLRQFVEQFGRRAMRRPLSEDEINAYLSLQSYATESNDYVENDFYTAVGLIVQAVVQDPEFLYRIEVGTPTTEDGIARLTEWEVASRMSFLLWGSTPDDQLLADAEAGMLSDAEGRRAATERLLQGPRAREQMHRYHSMWLGYRGIPVSTELVNAFSDETSALIDRVIFDDDTPYSTLFTMDETYINDTLAQHYGLPSPGGGQDWVAYGNSGRSGILGHGSVLAAFSKFNDTSPTQRGIFVRTRLTCIPVPDPPPDVDVDNEPVDPENPDACKEERYAAHREIASCAACHDQFDPIGLGLENYNIEGAFRESDNGRPECTISGDGALPGIGNFNGPAELAQRLTESGYLEPCALEHYLAFAYGRALLDGEDEHVDAFLTTFEEVDYSFAGLLTEFVAADVFGYRREPE